MSGRSNQGGGDRTGQNKTQEVIFPVLETSGRKMLNGGMGRGAQFLWQQASWETAVNQSMKEISRGGMIKGGDGKRDKGSGNEEGEMEGRNNGRGEEGV